ncbi:MAG TPA: SpoIID/LytB domain-containing protein [Gaiellaceae bacterium]|nr:SpoIID/LytB domain-containing protein [Gaiellaceae bacterium]
MARRALIPILAALALAGPAAGARFVAPTGSGALFLFSGHGWGHGVGMSQYGAYGYALNGWTYDQILSHYYPGTKLAKAPASAATIRVLLADARTSLTVASAQPFTLVDGNGAQHTLAAGKAQFGAGLKLLVDGAAARTALTPPLTFSAATGATLALSGKAYRGRLLVDVVDGKLRAIDVVPLDAYLDGVVPSEMPSKWPDQALRAQAVAARSYALSTRLAAAPFDVYGDTRSQAYGGVARETAATNAAVQETSGQVLMYGAKIATTYYSSTSGGETESAQDAWGGRAVPYLVSVTDPFDVLSPYHDWGPVPVTGAELATQLKVPGTVLDATTTPNVAGRVATLDVSSLAGAPPVETDTSVSGGVAEGALGLRSTWFDVGVLSLTAPATASVPYGSTVTLTGLVRGVDDAWIETRHGTSAWQEVGPAVPDDTGAITLTATPLLTTDFRLATADAAAAYVRVKVAPQVTMTSLTATGASGSVLPAVANAAVVVQQQTGYPAWTNVAEGTTDATGSFTVPATLVQGTYRVLVTPGNGLAQGVSAPASLGG